MAITTTIDVSEIEIAIRSVRGAAERARDLSPVLQVYAEDTRTLVDDSFEQSRAPSGEAWQGLAPATVRRRRQGSSKPLVDTSRLRNSIVARAERNVLNVGTNTAYAGFHQLGTRRIPARPFLPFEQGDGAELVLEMDGPAGVHWGRLMAAVREYILTGRVT